MQNKFPKMDELLTREEFKKYGFARTNGKCCIPGCCKDAIDAHHIMDRSLWSDGGYYLSNCAPVCNEHHIDCEKGLYTPIELTRYCNIDLQDVKKPDKLNYIYNEEYLDYFENEIINKWGE